jgi:hypothetical protein
MMKITYPRLQRPKTYRKHNHKRHQHRPPKRRAVRMAESDEEEVVWNLTIATRSS